MECSWLHHELDNTTTQPTGNHCYGLTSQNVSFILPSNGEGLYEVPTGIIVLLSIFYGSISVIAVVGNFLVMWIIATTRRMHTVTHYFIANLALADIVIGLFSVPFQFQAALLQRWNLPHFMCPFCPFVQILSVNVSIFMLTAIALDRHRAVLNPLSGRLSKSRAKVAISSVWTLGVILAVPMAVALRVTNIMETDLVGRVHVRPFCQNVHFSHVTMMYYRFVLFLLQYAVPLCIITCAYTRMAHRLWRSKAPGNAEDARDAAIMKNKKKVIKMLVIVVALFALCWLPLQTYNVLQELFPEINEYRYINIVWFCFDWLAMSNSCYNPFIYGIYNEKFKREFQKRFPALRSRHWSPAYSTDSVDLDRTAQSPLPTKVSLRLLHFDANNACRGYDSEHYWQIHQVHSRSKITRKPVHHFRLSEFPRGKDYCDLRVNYKNDLSKRIECSNQVSNSQFSSRLSSTNEEDDNDSATEKTELTTFLDRNSERRDSNELFPV